METEQNRMNEKEEIIYNSIRKNPYISQQELADILDLSRPTVANLISGLIKKGRILGKAYILNEARQIICIGGANVDRKFYMKEEAQLGTSNPVRSTQSAGGVARNVAENLGRLGKEVILLTACGTDADWDAIEKASNTYMNLDYVTAFPSISTGSYTAVLEQDGNLLVALADMEAYEHLTPDVLSKQEALLSRSSAIVADLNCPKETLEYLTHFAEVSQIPLVLVPVSSPKMVRLPEALEKVSWIICNRDESETKFGMRIETEADWHQAVQNWLDAGVQNVIVTNGKLGAMAGSATEGIIHEPAIVVENIQDVTGAGDAFCSAVIYAWLEGRSLHEILQAGSVNAARTLESEYTVRQNLSTSQLQKDLEELIK
ncbi:carbohydrate kinase [Listeria ilorinensis]|uniref:carbohydrate kinase n=1 Tax=Listeria ilorinensis TaxID=2867439 RepID=UPI001EF58A62|nr:carbohydrate kinase [Listeria ilorinensis]